jgi:glycosyltransferase involved in cell wall biosynthesis
MRIAHFNTFTEGGAAVLMLRLHQSLLDSGVESHVYYRKGDLFARNSRQLEFARTRSRRFRERVKGRLENWLLRAPGNLFTTLTAPQGTRLEEPRDVADIYHLHWISHWLDLPSFVASLPPEAPIVLTLHDFGNFTGGCHLYSGCHGFENDCRRCPLLKRPFDRFLARSELKRKKIAFGPRRVHVVGNSAWTTGMAAAATVFRNVASIRTIHPAIDAENFVCREKTEAKKVLGIPCEKLVVGFGCSELTDGNKDFGAFLELLRRISGKLAVEAVVFGNGLSLREQPPVRIHNLGKLASSRLLSLAYSAMDVFAMTSRMETFGQVAIEAQACATPVCAFEVGGLTDAVQDGVTGLLSSYGDLEAMAANVLALGQDAGRRQALGRRGCQWVRDCFTVEKAASAYLGLYEEALAGGKERPAP